ncbi:MAG: DUF3987 domain-containing protein [Microcoleus sp. SIO2G3]|nr:DUF3987 domain-containing protein [Microcoleus sp. SIO2G3]
MVHTPIKPSAPQERQEVIDWLIAHNYPVLPVAPAQDAKKHPKIAKTHPEQGVWAHCPLTEDLQPIQLYTGKNPSYLDRDGFPHLINHRQYQTRLPRVAELELWFANPENGVGTLGGWNDTVWLDFDVKQFPSTEECDAAVTSVLERVRASGDTPQQQTYLERSHSGGWRIALKLEQKPNFTNFSLTPGGAHVGEALFTGRFTVLAPTIGPSGNPYQSISRALPVSINSLSAIGIYSTKKGFCKGNQQLELVHSQSCNGNALPFSEEPDVNQRHPIPNLQSPIPSSIPLELLGHDTSRHILQGKCQTDDRSDALATAIQEWYGWQNWGDNNGIQISGNTIALTHQAGSLLGLQGDRINRILKTIDPTSCQPAALYRGGEESCWLKIYRLDKATFEGKCPAHIKNTIHRKKISTERTDEDGCGSGGGPGGGGSPKCGDSESFDGNEHTHGSGGVKLPKKTPPELAAIRSQIKNILIQDLPPSELQTAKIRIRTGNPGVSEREISRLFETIEQELEIEESREHRRSEVDNLLKLTDQSLNISAFLPADLAQPLEGLAQGLNIRPEVCLTSLLVAVSSLHKTTTELVIHRGQGFSVPPTIFAGLVSESGQKKSPILKTIIKKPLAVLQRENRLAFEEALIGYEKEIADWDKCKSEERSTKFPEGKPKKPQQRLYYFTNSTGEGLLYQFQAHPDKGLLALVDELVGLFASQNKYSGGRGSDRQDILSAFDGTGATILRAAGTKADIEGLSLSICGTIQPEVLKRLMRDCSDPDGQWARFLFVNQPLAAATLNDDDGSGLDLTGRLLNYYRAIDRLPAREYRLSQEAFKRYQPVYNQLERLRVSHPLPGMRAVYSKMEGYIGRLALNLHVLHELSLGKTVPDQEIPLQPLLNAIALAKFYIGQVKLIHANCSTDLGEMAPHLAKIVELSKRMESTTGNSWIKAKVVQSGYDSRHRPRPDAIRSWFRELEALSLGRTKGSGIRLEYSWKLPDLPFDEPDPPSKQKVEKVDKSGEKWITSPPTESPPKQGVQEKVEKVDTSLASDLGCDDVIGGESGFISRSDSFLLSPNSGTSLSPTEESILCKAMAHTDQAEDAQRFEGSQLMPNLTATCSFLESESTQSPLSGSSLSLITNPVSTSPLLGCDDAIASSQVVDTHSTFSPPVDTHSTFSPSVDTHSTFCVGEELDVKTPQPEAIEPATSRESSEMIHAEMHLRVFSLNQPAASIDSHSQETGVENGGMVVMNPTVLSQTPALRDTCRHALVTVEEVTPLSGLEESELLSLVAAAAIQGQRSFRVKWSLPFPNTVVAAETKLQSNNALIDNKNKGKCCDLTLEHSSAEPSAVQWNEVQGNVLKIGDRVYWSQCPAHCEQFAPFEITAIDGDYAKLDLFEKPVLLTQLHRSS